MNSRERVRAALNHKEPDRVPMDFGGAGFTAVAYFRLKEYLKITGGDDLVASSQVMERYDERVLKAIGIDFRRVGLRAPEASKIRADGSWVDEWGWTFRYAKGDIEMYAELVDRPLKDADIDDIRNYPWPDPYNPARVEGLADEAKAIYENTDFAIMTKGIAPGPFETCCWLRGIEQFLMDMAINKDFAKALIEKVTDIQQGFYEVLLAAIGEYLDVIDTCEDLGLQTGLIMSPEMYREFVKPVHIRLNSFIKARTRAKVMLHSCGAVFPLIGDFIESGVDLLNPLQPLAKGMDKAKIKAGFGDRMSFHGGIDIQWLLPKGSPAEVRDYVKNTLKIMAPGGGYILAPAHNIQGDTPPENIMALFDTGREYGRYPIKI